MKYETLTEEERKYKAGIGRYTLVIPEMKGVPKHLKSDFNKLIQDSVFEFKIKNSKPKDDSKSSSRNHNNSNNN